MSRLLKRPELLFSLLLAFCAAHSLSAQEICYDTCQDWVCDPQTWVEDTCGGGCSTVCDTCEDCWQECDMDTCWTVCNPYPCNCREECQPTYPCNGRWQPDPPNCYWGQPYQCNPQLCPPPPEWCGDTICNNGEDCGTCSADCGACPSPPFCGDGMCNGDENCGSCSGDCGSCPPPPPPSTTIYSDAWAADGEDDSGNPAPAAVVYGAGVTDTSENATVGVQTRFRGPDGGVLASAGDEGVSHARADVTLTVPWGTEGDYSLDSGHSANGGSVGATGVSPIRFSPYATRYRYIGTTGDGQYWQYAPHDCVTRCIKPARYYNVQNLSVPWPYLHCSGTYVRILFVQFCTGSCAGSLVPGQCWGPTY